MTGAAILVALIVLLVPELLSRPRHPGPEQAAAVDEAPIRSYRLSLGDSQQSATPVAMAPVTVQTPATAATPATPATPTTAATPQTPGTAAKPTATAAAPAVPTRVTVPARSVAPTPVMVPAKPETASGAAPRRKTAARPEKTASAAKAVSPEKAASSPKPARTEHASGGWAVQVGSFGSRENADRLVRSLKLKGYGAFITESSSRGRTWYRVRVGPERSRASADATAARLRAAGLRGAVAQAR